MSSISSTRKGDRVEFEVVETRPWGESDGHRFIPVALDKASQPLEPASELPVHYESTDLFYIPERGEWICFHFTSYQENSVGPNWDEYNGPYLYPDNIDLLPEEVESAKDNIITRRIVFPYEDLRHKVGIVSDFGEDD